MIVNNNVKPNSLPNSSCLSSHLSMMKQIWNTDLCLKLSARLLWSPISPLHYWRTPQVRCCHWGGSCLQSGKNLHLDPQSFLGKALSFPGAMACWACSQAFGCHSLRPHTPAGRTDPASGPLIFPPPTACCEAGARWRRRKMVCPAARWCRHSPGCPQSECHLY